MTIRHDCETGGCYIKTQSPDWGFLDSSFSKKIRPTDIDGCVEIKGHLLILEWKRTGADIQDGQRFMFEHLTLKNNITVFAIHGDPVETEVTSVKVWRGGTITVDMEATNETLKNLCRSWERRVRDNSL